MVAMASMIMVDTILCHKNTKRRHQKEYNKWKTLLELCYTEIVIRNECIIILYEI